MNEVEEKAKKQGWNPDYDGPNAKTAEEFIADGERIAAIASKNNKKLESELEDVKGLLKEMQDQQFKTLAEAKQQGYQQALKEIEKQQRAAVEDADVEKFDELEKEKKNLKKPEVEKPKKEPAIAPELKAWLKDNPWYNRDEDLTIAADVYAKSLARRNPDLDPTDFYNKVGKRVKKMFPENFETERPNNVETPSKKTQSKGKKKYSDLPPEAKKACDRQVKTMGISQEDYVNEYFKAVGE